MKCSIDDCNQLSISRGWCVLHYARWLKHGTTDLHVKRTRWDDFYELTAVDTDECIEWPHARSKGYGKVGRYVLARTVCLHNFGPPSDPKMHAAHSCGNPPCINWRHLRWATASENANDRWAQGTMVKGEAQHAARLTEYDVHDIRRRVAAGETQTSLAHEYGVHIPAISRIVHRKRWGWLDTDPTDTKQLTTESSTT